MKSVCPVLGEKHVKLSQGMCPLMWQKPVGKEFGICFGGQPPHIKSPNSGSDFLLLEMFAEKFSFLPKYMQVVDPFVDGLQKVRHCRFYSTCGNSALILTFKIITKECEVIIGQATEIYSYLFERIGFLPPMYDSIAYLRSRKPQEIASYETLIRPLEPSLWAITIGFIALVFMSLFTIQKVWSNLTGQPLPQSHIFQGTLRNILDFQNFGAVPPI